MMSGPLQDSLIRSLADRIEKISGQIQTLTFLLAASAGTTIAAVVLAAIAYHEALK